MFPLSTLLFIRLDGFWQFIFFWYIHSRQMHFWHGRILRNFVKFQFFRNHHSLITAVDCDDQSHEICSRRNFQLLLESGWQVNVYLFIHLAAVVSLNWTFFPKELKTFDFIFSVVVPFASLGRESWSSRGGGGRKSERDLALVVVERTW